MMEQEDRAIFPWLQGLILATFLFLVGQLSQAQVAISSIPPANGGVVEVCSGSTILFTNQTPINLLNGPTSFDWEVDEVLLFTTSGPISYHFDAPGTYEVELAIVTQDGEVDLGSASITVVVGEAPPLIPTLGTGNSCTELDTLGGIPTFQTQSGSSCLCQTSSMGPAISLEGTNLYPTGTNSQIYWGGPGNISNGGTSPFTTQSNFPTANTSLTTFPGQITTNGHYSTPGSYNLVHVVQFPGGCTYSNYYVMSWGAALIDQCANASQSVCSPLDYAVCFDSQAPGTTYIIEWGDGQSETIAYPNLPVFPNVLGHTYAPTCGENSSESSAYSITITAENACELQSTVNTQGPIYVSTPPVTEMEFFPGNTICQFDEVSIVNATQPGFEASPSGCTEDYIWAWEINGSNELLGPGYQVLSGEMGDLSTGYESGSGEIDVVFGLPGNYLITLTTANAFCSPNSVQQIITVNPTPVVPDQEITLCTGAPLNFVPPAPPALLPPGTTFEWTVIDNPQVSGDMAGDGTVISAALENLSSTAQTVVYTVTPNTGPCPGEPFVLTVNLVPTVVVPNSNLTVCNGATFTIAPTDDPPSTIIPLGTTYSWTFADNPNVTGETNGNQQSQFSQTLTSSVISPAQSVTYSAQASAAGGCGTGNFDIVITLNDVQAGVLGSPQLICPGGNPAPLGFITPSQGSGTLSYQWQSAPIPGNIWTSISGATDSTYLPPSGLNASMQYRVVVTSTLNGASCSESSNSVAITVNNLLPPVIASGQTLCPNGDPAPVSLTSGGTASGTLSYQWQSAPSSSGPWQNISGAQSPTYDPPAGLAIDTWLQLQVTSTYPTGQVCSLTSGSTPLVVNEIVPGSILSVSAICAGGDPAPLQSSGATGDGVLSYAWGQSASSTGPFTPNLGSGPAYDPPGPIFDDTWFQLTVTSTLNGVPCSASTAPLVVPVNTLQAGVSAPGSVVCEGGDPDVLIPVALPAGEGVDTYQWQFSVAGGPWTNITGATGTAYDPPAGLTQTTQYQIILNSALDGTICQQAGPPTMVEVLMLDPGTLIGGGDICEGGDPSGLQAAGDATGPGELTYQWQQASGMAGPWVDIEGAMGGAYDPPAGLAYTTYYRLLVTSTWNGITCTEATPPRVVQVVPDPVIVSQPGPAPLICVGGALAAPLAVVTQGGLGSASYQWFDGDGPIPGANGATYLPPAFSAAGGQTYSLQLSWSGSGCDTLLTVPLVIEVQPDPMVGVSGAADWCQGAVPLSLVSSFIGATGSPSYQWYSGADAGNLAPIPGANGSTFLPSTGTPGLTYYAVTGQGDGLGCSGISNPVPVEIYPGPSFANVTDSQAVCIGAPPVILAVDVISELGVPTFQWYASPSGNWGDAVLIPGADEASFSASAATLGTVWYFCEVTVDVGGCGAIVSPSIPVTTAPLPTAALEVLAEDVVCVGGSLPSPLTTMVTGGAGEITYQWWTGSVLIPGAIQATYFPANYAIPGSYSYSVEVSWSGVGCDAVTTAQAVVEVVADPVVGTQPVGASYCQGAAGVAPLTVAATGGTGTFAYQWQSSANPGGPWANVAGATGASFTPPVGTVGTVYYRCRVTQSGANCEVNSTPAAIVTTPAPTFTQQPASQTLCVAQAPQPLQVAYTNGTGTPSYQWYTTLTGSPAAGQPIPGATQPSYTPPTAQPGAVGYYCEITLAGGGCAMITSQVATVFVNGVQAGLLQPGQAICSGTQPAPLGPAAPASGNGALTYQWLAQTTPGGPWTPVPGATTAVWQPPVLQDTLQYQLQVTSTWNNVGCSALTAPVEIIVYPLPQIPALPALTLCNGESFEIPLTSDLPATYNWAATANGFVDGETVGEVEGDLVYNTLQNNTSQPQTVLYTAVATSVPYGCPAPPVTASVQVMPDIVLVSAQSMDLCSDAPVNAVLLANVPSNFNWFVTFDNPQVTGETIGGGTGNLIDDVLVNQSATNQLVVYSISPTSVAGTCPGAALTLAVLVKPPLAIVSPVETTICSGSPVNLTLVANSDVVFNWYAEGVPAVQGETTGLSASPTISDVLTVASGNVAQVTYQVLASSPDDGCSSALTPVVVQVNPVPVIDPIADLGVCHGDLLDAVTFGANVLGTSFAWVASTPQHVGLPTASGTGAIPGWQALNGTDQPQSTPVTVTPTFTANGVGCTGVSQPFSVSVMPVPQVNAMSDWVLCAGQTLNPPPFSSTVPGTTYAWSSSASGLGLPGSGTGALPAFQATNGSLQSQVAELTVTPLYPNGQGSCPGPPESWTLTVHPAPQLLPLDDTVCSGEAADIDLAADLASSLVWSAQPHPQVTGETAFPLQTSAAIGDVLLNPGPGAATVLYAVTPTSLAHSCPGPTSLVPVLVHPLPDVAFAVLNDVLCDSVEVQFANTTPGLNDYLWDLGNGASSAAANPTALYPDIGSYTVTLEAVDVLTGCRDETSQVLTVFETPDPAFFWSDSTSCGPEEVTFTSLTQDPGLFYLWDFGDGDFSTQVGTTGNQFAPGACYDLALTLTAPSGCTATAFHEQAFCAFESPVAGFTADPVVTTTIDPEVTFENQSVFATSFHWDFGDGAQSFDDNPVHSYAQAGTYVVKLTASNAEVCFREATLPIVIKPLLQVYVPNAFTADHDGINDAWRPVLSNPELLDGYRLTVFNRWGERVFETEDPEAWWVGGQTGTGDTGGEHFVPNEVYSWRLVLDVREGVAFDCASGAPLFDVRKGGSDCTLTGHVTLIR